MNTNESTALVRRADDELALRATPIDALLARQAAISEAMKKLMREGVDYGRIPGCGPKPTLLKPGAEKLCHTFGLAPSFKIDRRDLPDGHREYEIICTLVSIASGVTVGSGVGCATTMERRYRYRKGAENPDIADTYNTVLKIAKKRAQVDATLTAVGASDLLTQDIEDFGGDHEVPSKGSANVREASTRSEVRAPSQPKSTVEISDDWVMDLLGSIDEAATVDDLKALAKKVNAMPKGSSARRVCKTAFEERMAKLS